MSLERTQLFSILACYEAVQNHVKIQRYFGIYFMKLIQDNSEKIAFRHVVNKQYQPAPLSTKYIYWNFSYSEQIQIQTPIIQIKTLQSSNWEQRQKPDRSNSLA